MYYYCMYYLALNKITIPEVGMSASVELSHWNNGLNLLKNISLALFLINLERM